MAAVGLEMAVAGLVFPNIPFASVPDAADNRGLLLRSDDEPSGAGLLISNGATWLPYANSGVIMAAIASLALTVPGAASAAPPSVADAGAKGTILRYALENHTHASKIRKKVAASTSSGDYTWIYDTPLTAGATVLVVAIAQTAAGNTDLVNVQVVGVPSVTQAVLKVNRTNVATVALLGLNILSVPASPGVTTIHMVALEI